jgi:hypothetical protein
VHREQSPMLVCADGFCTRSGAHFEHSKRPETRQEKAQRRARIFRTDSAPDRNTDTDTGNRGVSDPGRARGTRPSCRGGVAHATVPFHLNRNRWQGRHKTPPYGSRSASCKSVTNQRVVGVFDVADGATAGVTVDRATGGWGLRVCGSLVPPRGPFLNPSDVELRLTKGVKTGLPAPLETLLETTRRAPWNA